MSVVLLFFVFSCKTENDTFNEDMLPTKPINLRGSKFKVSECFEKKFNALGDKVKSSQTVYLQEKKYYPQIKKMNFAYKEAKPKDIFKQTLQTIFNNISKLPYPKLSEPYFENNSKIVSRYNHNGLNHLRSVASTLFLISLIKEYNSSLYQDLLRNKAKGKETEYITSVSLAAMFVSLFRVDENSNLGHINSSKMPRPSLYQTNQANIRKYTWIPSHADTYLFQCIVENYNNLNIFSDDLSNWIGSELVLSSTTRLDINKLDQVELAIVRFGHYFDHCRPNLKFEHMTNPPDPSPYWFSQFLKAIFAEKYDKVRRKLLSFQSILFYNTGAYAESIPMDKIDLSPDYCRRQSNYWDNNKPHIYKNDKKSKFQILSNSFDDSYRLVFNLIAGDGKAKIEQNFKDFFARLVSTD
jgi:hypothetical protein